jgi:hypothetical protein
MLDEDIYFENFPDFPVITLDMIWNTDYGAKQLAYLKWQVSKFEERRREALEIGEFTYNMFGQTCNAYDQITINNYTNSVSSIALMDHIRARIDVLHAVMYREEDGHILLNNFCNLPSKMIDEPEYNNKRSTLSVKQVRACNRASQDDAIFASFRRTNEKYSDWKWTTHKRNLKLLDAIKLKLPPDEEEKRATAKFERMKKCLTEQKDENIASIKRELLRIEAVLGKKSLNPMIDKLSQAMIRMKNHEHLKILLEKEKFDTRMEALKTYYALKLKKISMFKSLFARDEQRDADKSN